MGYGTVYFLITHPTALLIKPESIPGIILYQVINYFGLVAMGYSTSHFLNALLKKSESVVTYSNHSY